MWDEQVRIARPWGPDGTRGRHAAAKRADIAAGDLPPTASYVCKRTAEPIVVDGRLDEAVWERAEWSAPFGLIAGGPASVETRVALLWDDTHLYAAYRVEDHDVRGTMGDARDHVYLRDDDVELLIDGDGHYYEIGLNPINNGYQMHWVWLERLVESQDFDALEQWLRTDDFIYYHRRSGERLGRMGDMNHSLPGLRTAVQVDGVLNQPAVRDRGWTVEMALPWAGLAEVSGGLPTPPRPGDTRRINAYRAHHHRADPDRYADVTHSMPWEQQTWSTMGNEDIHNPERWATVTFSDEVV